MALLHLKNWRKNTFWPKNALGPFEKIWKNCNFEYVMQSVSQESIIGLAKDRSLAQNPRCPYLENLKKAVTERK